MEAVLKLNLRRTTMKSFVSLLLLLIVAITYAAALNVDSATDEGVLGSSAMEHDDNSNTPPGPESGSGNTSAQGEEQNATESGTPKSGTPINSTQVPQENSPLALIYINTEQPGLGSLMTHPVFKESVLVGKFNSCKLSAEDPTKLANETDCFRDHEYNDRLTFEVNYKLPGSTVQDTFKSKPPALSMLAQSTNYADAGLHEVVVQAEDSIAKVTVAYRCKRDADGLLSLKLTMQFTNDDDSVVTLLWTKQCRGGVNSEIEFGYTSQKDANGALLYHPFGSSADPLVVVVPSDKSTEVYAKLLKAGAQQEFLSPYVRSDDASTVQVAVRGNHPSGGVLRGLEVTLFQVSYECLTGKGSTKILVSVAIPPFLNLTASWEKRTYSDLHANSSVFCSQGLRLRSLQ